MKITSPIVATLLAAVGMLFAVPAAATDIETAEPAPKPRLNLTFICFVDPEEHDEPIAVEQAAGGLFDVGEYVFRVRERDGLAGATGVEVRLGDGDPIDGAPDTISADETIYVALPKGAGYTVYWDGGDKGVASSNESQACTEFVPEPEPEPTATETPSPTVTSEPVPTVDPPAEDSPVETVEPSETVRIPTAVPAGGEPPEYDGRREGVLIGLGLAALFGGGLFMAMRQRFRS